MSYKNLSKTTNSKYPCDLSRTLAVLPCRQLAARKAYVTTTHLATTLNSTTSHPVTCPSILVPSACRRLDGVAAVSQRNRLPLCLAIASRGARAGVYCLGAAERGWAVQIYHLTISARLPVMEKVF